MTSTTNKDTIYCEYGDCWEWDREDPSDVPTKEYFIQPFDNTPTGRYKMLDGKLCICPSCDGAGHIETLHEKLGTYAHVICRACEGLGVLRG